MPVQGVSNANGAHTRSAKNKGFLPVFWVNVSAIHSNLCTDTALSIHSLLPFRASQNWSEKLPIS